MRNSFISLLLFALVVEQGCTVSRDRCNQLYPPQLSHSADTVLLVKETLLHDTTYIAADNSEFEIILEADTDNGIKVVSERSTRGKRSRLGYSTTRAGKQLHATFNCNCDSLAIYHVFKSADTTLRIAATETKTVPVSVPAQFTWWQQFKIAYGGWAFLLIALYLLFRIGWWALKTYTGIQFPFTRLIR